jgi:hypothetical protein
MADDTKINPVGWGILFFTFWGLVYTIPSLQKQCMTLAMAWLSLVVSIIMFFGILPFIRKRLEKPRIQKYLKTFVSGIATIIYFFTYLSIMINIDNSMRELAAWVGFIWPLIFIFVGASNIPRKFSWIVVLITLGAGIYAYFMAQTDKLLTIIIFSLLTIVSFVCSWKRWPWLADLSLF